MLVRSSIALFVPVAFVVLVAGCGGDGADPSHAQRDADELLSDAELDTKDEGDEGDEGDDEDGEEARSAAGHDDPRFHRVEVSKSARAEPTSDRAAAPSSLRIERGRHFQYALPEGWRVGEDGQFAVTLVAPDDKALTILVGNAGMPPGYPADRYVYEKLTALQPGGLRLGAPRSATPIAGFERALEFDVTYSVGGIPCRGVAKWQSAGAYDTATMVMTAALSEERQWASYSSWLPAVAEQISATDGAAFGARGVMAQNLQNSMAFADAAKRYRESTQKNWQKATDERNASVDGRNEAFRENLGAVRTWSNPYDTQRPVELPTTYSHYWIDQQGNVLGTNDPSANPNVGSTADWRALQSRRD